MVLVATAPMLPNGVQAVLYAVGAAICHQRPERSFHVGHVQLPVCARCFGIYAGAAAAAVVTATWQIVGSPTPMSGWIGGLSPRARLAIVGLPTVASVMLEWMRVWDPQNVGRAVAGVVLGAGVAVVVLTLHYDECVPRRPNVPYRPPTHF